MVHSNPPSFICVVLFGNQNQDSIEIWIAKQCPDTGNDITKEDLADLIPDHYFMSFERWPPGKIFVNNFVELIGIFE